jgi:CBS domain-containing protein
MRAADIMTREVVTVGPDASVCEIAALLLLNRISAVPVVDEAGHVLGLVSEGDLLGRPPAGSTHASWLRLFDEGAVLLEEIATARHLKARDVMTKPAVTVGDDTPIAVLATLMRRRRLKRVPILHQGKLAGIVSRADLLDALMREDRPAGESG